MENDSSVYLVRQHYHKARLWGLLCFVGVDEALEHGGYLFEFQDQFVLA
jgi:hypothetical protein